MKKPSLFILIFLLLLPLFVATDGLAASSENINKKKAFYFYQETCTHCQVVDKYFKENGVYDKYDINKIEISGIYNLSFFNEFFDAFDIPSEKRGWPAIFFGQKFLVGDKPIQEKFVNEIEKTDANNFPSPEVIKQYRTNTNDSLSEASLPHAHVSLLILLEAALADSISPCMLAIFVILASMIIFGNPRNKKEVFIFGLFFLLSVFLIHLILGIGMFGLGKIFRLSKIPSILLGLVVILSGFFVLRKYWQNIGMVKWIDTKLRWLASHELKGVFEVVWKLIKKIIQKMNLAMAALLIGAVSSGFFLPCANKPYGVFTSSFSGEKEIFISILAITLYNLIFILPVVFLSSIFYWFAHAKKLEIFRNRHDKLIRLVMGVGLLFVGSYFVYSNCF